MAEDEEGAGDDFNLDQILVGGATWSGKDRRSKPRGQAEPVPELAEAPAPEEPAVAPTAPPIAEEPKPAEEPGEAEVSTGLPAGPSAATEASVTADNASAGGEKGVESLYKWRQPEERAAGTEEVLAARRGGPLKRGGAGSTFVLAPEPEKVDKPKRRIFDRGDRLKVEKAKAKEEVAAPVVDTRVVRGRAAKFSRMRVPVKRHHLAVISGAGGTGKTTVALMLAWLLSEARETGVVALEAMPAGGAFAQRLGFDLELSSADVFRIAEYAKGLEDVQAVTHKFGKLEVVGTDDEPRLADLLDPSEYEKVLELLLRYYSMIVTDTETGLLVQRTTMTLERADQIVFCTTTDEGAVWRTAATLNWLLHQGGEAADLARRTVVVATEVREGTLEGFAMGKEQILSRCRAVMTIPFDAQFAQGNALDLANVADKTYEAYLDVAVELAHEFGTVSR